ncbi:MAG: tRNA(fMet)-specific endonuclease VapC [Methanoregula sp. PtaU1.Bin051]|nr:MAG: tRNA(fMet)-specific endonuclease VapC [Methanoregula sp. PtaU1.Bin051]
MNRPGILVDTYAWIEILKNTGWGQRALTLVEGNAPVFVSVLSVYELYYVLEEKHGRDVALSHIATILSHAEVIPVDNRIAFLGGSIKSEQKKKKKKMGAVDCLILATAQVHNLKVLTGDLHFKGCRETIDIL